MPYEKARRANTTEEQDFITPFVNELSNVVDLRIIKEKLVKITFQIFLMGLDIMKELLKIFIQMKENSFLGI